MRLSLRFVLPLMLVLAGIAYAVAPLVDQLTLKWFVRDLDIRAALIANAIQEPLQEQLAAGKKAKIGAFFARITQDERLYAVGYCASDQSAALASRALPAEIRCTDLSRWEEPGDHLLASAQGPLHVAVKPLTSELGPAGKLVLVHDMSFVTRRSEETKRYVFYFFMALAAVVSLITVIIAQLSWRGWMAGMRSLLRGEGLLRQPEAGAHAGPSEFRPIARDLQRLVRELEAETRARDESQITWTPESCAPSSTASCAARTSSSCPIASLTSTIGAAGSHRGAAPRQRTGHGAGTDHARLLRHLDRPRQRQRRSRGGRPPRPCRRAAGQARLPYSPGLAHGRGRSRLLLRLLQRRPVAAVPHRACAADLPLGRLGAVRRGESQVRHGRGRARPGQKRPSCWCRTTTSRCCRG
jgi:hypothetical protein